MKNKKIIIEALSNQVRLYGSTIDELQLTCNELANKLDASRGRELTLEQENRKLRHISYETGSMAEFADDVMNGRAIQAIKKIRCAIESHPNFENTPLWNPEKQTYERVTMLKFWKDMVDNMGKFRKLPF